MDPQPRPYREAELDGTQAIADALEVKDTEPILLFGGVPLRYDPNAPVGTLYLTNSATYVFDGTAWQKGKA